MKSERDIDLSMTSCLYASTNHLDTDSYSKYYCQIDMPIWIAGFHSQSISCLILCEELDDATPEYIVHDHARNSD